MSREDEIRQLIVNHRRHLQKLKEQQASFGSLNTPAHILTEIEDTEAAIEELETELMAVADNSIDRESPDVQSVTEGSITSKTEPQTVGGITIFNSSQLRYLGFLGIAIVVLAIILLLANRTTRFFALVPVIDTATPTSTPTTAPTEAFTPTGTPTHTLVPPTNTPIPSTPTPTLTPTPESFSYIAKIADKSTGQDISAAEVTIEVSGFAPISSITDSDGYARIPINSILSGQPAILVIEAEGYIVHSKHIDLIQGMLPGLVMLAPLKAQEECIPWVEADDHINEVSCVFGDVVSTYDTENAFFVNFSPDKTSFYAVSFGHRWDNLDGRCIKLHGFIEEYEGRTQLVIRRESQVEFCN